MLWTFRQRLGDFIKDSTGRSRQIARERGHATRDLSGDREIEWSYVLPRIGQYTCAGARVLDFGCGSGILSRAAASVGAQATAIDLLPQQFANGLRNVDFLQTDVMDLDARAGTFDLVVQCSVIEHVGVGGRYGARNTEDMDLAVMRRLGELLRADGRMVMTLPVGRDAVMAPFHRIYGAERLPRLLSGFTSLESNYWRKREENTWEECSAEEAMEEEGNDHYYALGAMVLVKDREPAFGEGAGDSARI